MNWRAVVEGVDFPFCRANLARIEPWEAFSLTSEMSFSRHVALFVSEFLEWTLCFFNVFGNISSLILPKQNDIYSKLLFLLSFWQFLLNKVPKCLVLILDFCPAMFPISTPQCIHTRILPEDSACWSHRRPLSQSLRCSSALPLTTGQQGWSGSRGGSQWPCHHISSTHTRAVGSFQLLGLPLPAHANTHGWLHLLYGPRHNQTLPDFPTGVIGSDSL